MTQLTREQMLAVFDQRRSCRYYDANKKISDADFAAILEFARQSPSSVGSEPWHFLVIQNKALRDKLKPFSWGMATKLDTCSHLVIILAKKNVRYDSAFLIDSAKRRGVEEAQMPATMARYKAFQENDMGIADNERALFDWASKQTYIALGNMLTGAAALGIDSCPIEGFNYALMNQTLSEAGLFDPQEYAVSVAATFGYKVKDIAKKARKPLADIVTWAK